MKKILLIISLSIIFVSLFLLSSVYSATTSSPCGMGTDNQSCPCISQPVIIPECTITPKYSANGCLAGHDIKCEETNQTTIQCYKDDDCGGSIETRYCDNSNACTKKSYYKCENPGTFDSMCFPVSGGGTCTSCPAGCENGFCKSEEESCKDSDGGKNYYVKGYVDYNNERYYDNCINSENFSYLEERLCEHGTYNTVTFTCPNGCQDGVCKKEYVSEQVKCIFKDSKGMQSCYIAGYNNEFSCFGTETCTMDVKGYYGEKMVWKSTCGGYAYTIIDGNSEYAEFDCSTSESCTSKQCSDGSYTTCKKDSNGYCSCSTCPPIIIEPVCGNGICESGEGEICSTTAVSCEVNKECKTSESKCFYVCEQDCKNLPGIYAKLNEKFKLEVSQGVKITNYKAMKITFRDLLTLKCAGSTTTSSEVKSKLTAYAVAETTPTTTSATTEGSVSIIKCPNVGPMAQLEIEIPNVEGKKILTLKIGEAKNIYDVSVSFLGYDYASRTGTFIVNSQTSTCPIDCKCDNEGRVITCPPKPTCEEGQALCPDGVCREKCEIENITDTDCNSGCIYNNKCLPLGIRVKGLYCGLDGSLSEQLGSDKACENNFECSSNICVNNQCVSGSFIKKIIDWFTKLFGGGNDNKYACPEEKIINCMPSVPEGMVKYCSGSYHDWIEKNCKTKFVY